MTELRRTLRCSNCGNEVNVHINSELDLQELTMAGKCSRCGNSMQVNYNIVDKGASPTSTQSQSSQSSMVNLDETLFTPEIPSDAIRDLMED